MDKTKYDLLKDALLNHLKIYDESTHKDIMQMIVNDFKKNKIKFKGSIEWHLEWVKLDLEAKKEIKRIKGTSPVKFVIVKNGN
jgi:hypothetical protein